VNVSQLGIGIIGAGFAARVHARAAQQAGARLIGVVGSGPEQSLEAAAALNAEMPFADARTLIEHPDVSVVHICTPNYLHRDLVESALALRKHVVCEKPLATSPRDAEHLARRAAEAGVVAAVPFAYRYQAMVQEARAMVRDGQLGSVHVIHGSYLQDWLLSADNNNWRVNSDLGGKSRAFADIGSHWCDLTEWVSGQRILEVCATVQTVVPKRAATSRQSFESGASEAEADWQEVDTEDVACLLFRMTGDIVGTLTVSQVAAGRKNRIWIEIEGSEGNLAFNEERPDRLWIGRSGANQEVVRDPAQLSPDARRVSTLPAGHHEGFNDQFAAFLRDVYAAVAGGLRQFPNFDDGVRSAHITDAVLRSSASRSWVEVEPAPDGD
jgi:predicted dehydrogenase